MAPQFLLPETVIVGPGSSAASEIRVGLRAVQVTLGITASVEQQSIDVSVEASCDGTTWLAKAVASFPQRFYVGTAALVFELPTDSAIQFLRLSWHVNRWGRGSLQPRFSVYAVLEPLA